MGKLTFILGGARSGKSTFAERLASQRGERVAYVATAQALDGEMAARIAEHRRKRPASWQTHEIPVGVGQEMISNPPEVDVIVLDCLTLLVSNSLLKISGDLDERPEHSPDAGRQRGEEHFLTIEDISKSTYPSEAEYSPADYGRTAAAISQELDELQEAIRRSTADWIVVSNEVGMGLVPPYPQGRVYRDLLGWANQRLASMADRVYFMVAGIPMRLTPEP